MVEYKIVDKDGEKHLVEPGVFGDKDHGKLHETMAGYETINFGENYNLEKNWDGSFGVRTDRGREGTLERTSRGSYEFNEKTSQSADLSKPAANAQNDISSYPSLPYYGSDSSSSNDSLREESPDKKEGSASMPWQGVAATIFGIFGLSSLAEFFYSAASEVYILERHQPVLSAKMLEKAWNLSMNSEYIDLAFTYLVMRDEIEEAKRIARENGFGKKLLDRLQEYPKREEAAEWAREIKSYPEAIMNYETLGNITFNVFQSMQFFEEAAQLAEISKDTGNAIRLYKKGWKSGTPKDSSYLTPIEEADQKYADGLLRRAENLEKIVQVEERAKEIIAMRNVSNSLLKKTKELREKLQKSL